jgi:hypothetical protein
MALLLALSLSFVISTPDWISQRERIYDLLLPVDEKPDMPQLGQADLTDGGGAGFLLDLLAQERV